MLRAPPLLPARLVPAVPGVSAHRVVRCDWCEEDHSHSAALGHRTAHCTCADSPYRATGYELGRPHEMERGATATEPLYFGRQRLREVLVRVAPRHRSTLLAAILGARPGRHLDRRIGRARISVFGDAWIIDPDAYPSRAELQAPRQASRAGRMGRDFITLLAALYGMARGVVAVRLFEAVSGMSLDAEFRRAMAEEIEAAYARAGEGDGARP